MLLETFLRWPTVGVFILVTLPIVLRLPTKR